MSTIHFPGNILSDVQGIALAHESLGSALRRVRGEVLDPYNTIKQKTLQLKNLQATTDLLRHTVQSVKLIQRLRSLMGADGETLKLSACDVWQNRRNSLPMDIVISACLALALKPTTQMILCTPRTDKLPR